MRCGQCGNAIPDWANGVCYTCGRIEKEQQRFGSRRQARTRSRKRGTSSNRAPRPARDLGTDKIGVSRVEQRKGINRLLRDIYGKTQLLSDILYAGGFTRDQVTQLRDERLTIFLMAVAQRWCAWIRTALPEKAAYVLIRQYALQGWPVPPLKQLGEEVGLTAFRVSRLRQTGLTEIRRRPNQLELERLVCEAAHNALPAEAGG